MTLPFEPFSAEEEFSCLWQECGFCSLDDSADLIRHVYFHCYHTKLKQWGLQALQSQADLSPCILDFQSRNIVPDIPDHFLCLWEHCEVSGSAGNKGGRNLGSTQGTLSFLGCLIYFTRVLLVFLFLCGPFPQTLPISTNLIWE